MVRERNASDRVVTALIYVGAGLLALASLAPLVHILALSLSSFGPVMSRSVSFWPMGLQFENYAYLLRDNQVGRSLAISVARVVLGVSVNLFIAAITAYPLSRDSVRMPGRTVFKILLLIGMLFNAGLIPYFLTMRRLGLYDNFAVLILPGALNVFYVIVIANFFRGVPAELVDAAMVDGASHFDVLARIFLPVSKPALATIALFSAVVHWNSWFDGILYLRLQSSWPLQTYAYQKIVGRILQATVTVGSQLTDVRNLTPEALSAAFIVLTALPIILVYPVLQRYFLTGLTLGAIKG